MFRMIRQRKAILAAVAIVAGLLLIATAGGSYARDQAIAAADILAARTARSHAGLLGSELQKFRLLPDVLAEYPDVTAALATHDAAPVARLNRAFELLARRTDAAAIYLIDADGLTLAANNWRLPTSFVGSNYGFRPYFRDAMRNGKSELFALGTVSGRPGLYLARRLDIDGQAAGTIDGAAAGLARLQHRLQALPGHRRQNGHGEDRHQHLDQREPTGEAAAVGARVHWRASTVDSVTSGWPSSLATSASTRLKLGFGVGRVRSVPR